MFTVSLGLLAAGALAGCKDKEPATQGPAAEAKAQESAQQAPQAPAVTIAEAPPIPDPPLGLPPTPAPADNPDTSDKVALGELLFFDKRLSDAGEYACVTCHVPQKGWTDGLPVSPKHDGSLNSRHSPALYNVAYATAWYWDGRMPTLEKQIKAAWTGQMGATPATIAARLAEIPAYQARFARAFGAETVEPDHIPMALASFVRIALRSGDAPWDRYQAGDTAAVSADAIAGYEIFTKKAACVTCHAPPLFTDMAYHNVGIGFDGKGKPDDGRHGVSKEDRDRGAFKTPGLRGVALTPPYFHDGSAATLEEAVRYMVSGGHRDNNPTIDPLLRSVELSDEEIGQLIAFLESLTPEQGDLAPPKLP